MALSNAGRLFYFHRLAQQVEGIAGDIVECGVGHGTTLLALAELVATNSTSDRMLWGFDSFQGFPEPTADDESPRRPRAGEWAVSTPRTIVVMLSEAGLSPEWIRSRVQLIPGFFEDTLQLHTGDQIALLHLDCDLYQSYRVCLEQLYPKVATGGIIAFDEYATTWAQINYPGARKAIDEFAKAYQLEIKRDEASSRYYTVKP